jgi:hypothetical protein
VYTAEEEFMKSIPFIVFGLVLIAQTAWAEVSNETSGDTELQEQVRQLTEAVRQLKSTVQSQQTRITELEQVGSPPPAVPSAMAPSARLGASPVAASTSSAKSSTNLSVFNPEIGVVGDIVGQLSESSADDEGNDKITAREVELIFGHPIDPYSRLDVTIAVPELEAAELEEAYITHWGLPEAKTRLGRFKPKLGKAIAIHRDSLDTVDEPLVIQKYFGVEGLSRTGVDVSGFLPAPWTAVTHELTAGVMEGGVGEGGALFGETRRRPSFYAHLKNFWDISDTSNVELGTTYLVGSKDEDSKNEVNALGLDATLVHYVTPTNKLKWQNEAYFQHRSDSVTFGEADEDTGEVPSTSVPNAPWGFYSLLDYRLSPRFGIGGQFDYVEPVDVEQATLARNADTSWAGYLTFYQSEFSRWRLQFRHTNFAEGGDDNSIFAQCTVAIGVHKHALQ